MENFPPSDPITLLLDGIEKADYELFSKGIDIIRKSNANYNLFGERNVLRHALACLLSNSFDCQDEARYPVHPKDKDGNLLLRSKNMKWFQKFFQDLISLDCFSLSNPSVADAMLGSLMMPNTWFFQTVIEVAKGRLELLHSNLLLNAVADAEVGDSESIFKTLMQDHSVDWAQKKCYVLKCMYDGKFVRAKNQFTGKTINIKQRLVSIAIERPEVAKEFHQLYNIDLTIL